jgi:hypothetical protein
MRKQILAILVATAFIGCFIPMAGAQSDQAIINVTLNPTATVDISCNQSVWASSAALGTSDATERAGDWANITNAGNVQVSVSVKAADADEVWTIGATAAHNVFHINVTGTNAVEPLTAAPQSFYANMAVDAYTHFGLALDMPTTSSTNASQHFAITFQATAD